jgi:hypothetical protein
MNRLDWTSYEFQPAPSSLLCQFRERGSDLVFVDYAADFSPTVAVGCLEWKLTGIAREELERMSPEGRAQVMPQAGFGMLVNLLGRMGCGPASPSSAPMLW